MAMLLSCMETLAVQLSDRQSLSVVTFIFHLSEVIACT